MAAPSLRMLDTNAVSTIVKGPSEVFRMTLLATPMSEICVSAITAGELRFGLAKRPEAVRLATAVENLLRRMDILPWDSIAAEHYGRLRATLVRAGTPLGNLDTLIAAHALAVGAELITNDGAFRRVPGLAVADWTVGQEG